MCVRYTLHKNDAALAAIAQALVRRLAPPEWAKPRYNVTLTHVMPVVAVGAEGPEVRGMMWGLSIYRRLHFGNERNVGPMRIQQITEVGQVGRIVFQAGSQAAEFSRGDNPFGGFIRHGSAGNETNVTLLIERQTVQPA